MSGNEVTASAVSKDDRGSIARWVVGGSAIGLIVLSVLVLIVVAWRDTDKLADTTRMVYMSLLPLLGTWVGTVLAYYFSKDNFEAAAKNTRENLELALQQRLEKMLVEPNMRSFENVVAVTLEAGKSETDINLKDVVRLIGGRVTRVPIFDQERKFKYLIHKSILYEFIASASSEMANAGKPFKLDDLNLKDLLDFDDVRALTQDSVAFVRRIATLAEAKEAMERFSGSQDVLVTENGSRDEIVLGWLTNTRITKLANA